MNVTATNKNKGQRARSLFLWSRATLTAQGLFDGGMGEARGQPWRWHLWFPPRKADWGGGELT